MRILIKFKECELIDYRQNHLQGLVYNLLRLAGFGDVHKLPGRYPRFFNFSQLFLSKDKKLTLIISSPIRDLILSIGDVLKVKDEFYIYDKIIQVEGYKVFEPRLDVPIFVRTETPVIVRIPRSKYELYGLRISPEIPYFYWRPGKYDAPFGPFVIQLEANLYRKYRLYLARNRGFGSSGERFKVEMPVFMGFKYIKTVDVPYYRGSVKISRPGTIWEFELNHKLPDKFLRFIIDIGVGELNGQGYGFLNPIKGVAV